MFRNTNNFVIYFNNVRTIFSFITANDDYTEQINLKYFRYQD